MSCSVPPSSLIHIAARIVCVSLFAATMVLQIGCGLASNLMHGLGVDMIPAEYDGLEENTVAVVTLTDSSQYFNDVAAKELSTRVGEILTRKVKQVKLIRADQIDKWRDVNGWDAVGFEEIGQGVGAQKVLGIELSNLKLREGPTLYRGSSEVTVSVIDAETGLEVYKRTIDEFTYPTMAGRDASGTSESRFRKLYLTMLAQEIARSFHPYDMSDRIAIDSEGINEIR